MDFQEIIAGTVGKENTFGTCVGRVKAGPMSFARFSTNDREGTIHGYRGRRRVHQRSAGNFGGAGVVRIRICRIYCATSASADSSITWRRILATVASPRCVKRPRATWDGACISITEMTWVVAGVDFGTLSVRVSIFDSARGTAGRGDRRISAAPQEGRSGPRHAKPRGSYARAGGGDACGDRSWRD